MGREKIGEVCNYFFALGARLWFVSEYLCAFLSACPCARVCLCHTLFPRVKKL